VPEICDPLKIVKSPPRVKETICENPCKTENPEFNVKITLKAIKRQERWTEETACRRKGADCSLRYLLTQENLFLSAIARKSLVDLRFKRA
jgi:hypothetical protein